MDNKTTERKKVAVLIDAENVSLEYYETILAKAESEGDLIIKRAYRDFSYAPLEYPIIPDKTPKKLLKAAITLEKSKKKLLKLAINPVQCYSIVSGKNTADLYLAMDAMELLYEKNIDVFCIASSDSDFVPLVVKLKEAGKRVVGIGESKSVSSFKISCNEFITLDVQNGNKKPPLLPVKVTVPIVKATLNVQGAQDTEKDGNTDEQPDFSNSEGFPKIDENRPEDTETNVTDNGVERSADECDAEESVAVETAAHTEKNAETALTLSPEEENRLKAVVISVLEAGVDQNNCMSLSTIITEMQKRIPGFSARNCGYANATHMIESLGLSLFNKGSSTAFVWLDNGDPSTAPPIIKCKDLFSQMVGILEVLSENGEWCLLSTLIGELKKQDPDFSPKKYGVKKVSELIRYASDIIELDSRHLDTNNPKSSIDYVRLKKRNKPAETIDELKSNIETILRNAANAENGWVRHSYVSKELNKLFPFSPSMYGYTKFKDLFDQLGFETTRIDDASYVRLRLENADTVEAKNAETESDGETEAAANTKPAYENTVDDGDGVTLKIESTPADGGNAEAENNNEQPSETATSDGADTAEEEQPSDGREETEENDNSDKTDDDNDEEEEEGIVLPEVNELPEAIDTDEQLRDAIIFILTHESVANPTRLTAAIKYWFPDFKIKNYGCAKMPQLLDKLGLNVF